MKRQDFQELCDLSARFYGKKYEWKKLLTEGIIIRKDGSETAPIFRRAKLTAEQAKEFIQSRLKLKEQANASSTEGQNPSS